MDRQDDSEVEPGYVHTSTHRTNSDWGSVTLRCGDHELRHSDESSCLLSTDGGALQIFPSLTSMAASSIGSFMSHAVSLATRCSGLAWASAPRAAGPITSMVESCTGRNFSARPDPAKFRPGPITSFFCRPGPDLAVEIQARPGPARPGPA